MTRRGETLSASSWRSSGTALDEARLTSRARGVHRRDGAATTRGFRAAHLTEFLAAVDVETDGSGVPGFVVNEFRKFLRCGVLSHRFARVRCGDCAFERLVPFSCKGRALCPSCGRRRMTECASHLVDHDTEGWKAFLGRLVDKIVVQTDRLEVHLVIPTSAVYASKRSIQPSSTLSTLSRAVSGSFNRVNETVSADSRFVVAVSIETPGCSSGE